VSRIENREALLASAADVQGRARRELALDLFDAALTAVEPVGCTRQALRELRVRGELPERVVLFAFGKAARGMAEAALAELEVTTGIVIGHDDGELFPLTVHRGGHPVPAPDAPRHGAEVLALARSLGPHDTALVLVSGGGSAMLELPAPGLSLADIQVTTRALLASGANIREVNAVRAALSQLKGGRLAAELAPARVVNVVLSDVIGSPLSAIASGPTVAPDPDAPSAADVLGRYALDSLPKPVSVRLSSERAPFRMGFGHVTSVIAADNLTAQRAMLHEAERRGVRALRREASLQGEARQLGPLLLREAHEAGCVWIAGGEPTVTLGPRCGRGGRNQELVLSAQAGWISGLIASLGTDGIDGASQAAGALLDDGFVREAERRDLDVVQALSSHDSATCLSNLGAQLLTGKTGTNVADVCVVIPGATRLPASDKH
jgi:hydroxypyruvate reductase